MNTCKSKCNNLANASVCALLHSQREGGREGMPGKIRSTSMILHNNSHLQKSHALFCIQTCTLIMMGTCPSILVAPPAGWLSMSHLKVTESLALYVAAR